MLQRNLANELSSSCLWVALISGHSTRLVPKDKHKLSKCPVCVLCWIRLDFTIHFFLFATWLCTSQHHFFTQLCFFSGTLNVRIVLRTMEPKLPVQCSAGFCHGLCGSVVVVPIHCSLQCEVYVAPTSLYALSVFRSVGAPICLV
jgi:hypothetical protein